MKAIPVWMALLALFVFALLFWGCANENNPAAPSGETYRADCIGCHTNEAMLRAVASPDTTSTGDSSGEG
jgi:hypothetical protein